MLLYFYTVEVIKLAYFQHILGYNICILKWCILLLGWKTSLFFRIYDYIFLFHSIYSDVIQTSIFFLCVPTTIKMSIWSKSSKWNGPEGWMPIDVVVVVSPIDTLLFMCKMLWLPGLLLLDYPMAPEGVNFYCQACHNCNCALWLKTAT